MKIIKPLSSKVIAHIAAGQVVERPASVVKELLENSFDAGAKNIIIRVEDGGKRKIVITDDGCGMNADSVLLAIERYTTSKITVIGDLLTLSSYGFRGEALFSITQAGTVTIQSRSKDDEIGSKLVIKNGVVTSHVPVGMAVGTTVSVENIFATLPARKKFLKTGQTEFQYILDIFTQLALAFYEVGLQLYHNDKLVADYVPAKHFIDRAREVLGNSQLELFLPIEQTISDYKIYGLLGTPQAAAVVSSRQILLVNRRPVSELSISKTIKKIFGTLLPPTVHPPFILYLEVDPQTIDVNTHPRKEKIVFSEQDIVLDIIRTTTQKTLEDADLIFNQSSQKYEYLFNDSGMDSETAKILREHTTGWNTKNFFEEEPILQINKLYLGLQTRNGLLLIDQHAAHERILYEEFLAAFQDKNKKSTVLDAPQLIELPLLEAQIFTDNLDTFRELGFSVQEKGSKFFEITRVPQVLKNRQLTEYILEVIHDLYERVAISQLDGHSHRTIAYLACRTAIKAGEVLTHQERKNLCQKLLQTTSHYTCPHGRPVMVHLSLQELAKIFHRIPASRKEK